MTTRTYELRGGITGELWMGGKGWKSHDVRLSRNEHEPFTVHLEGLRETLDSILMRDGGDFNGARFTADTTLAIATVRGTHYRHIVHTHAIALVDCPSVADMVDPDVLSWDGEDILE